MKKYFLSITILLLTIFTQCIFSQTIIKKGFKGGVEVYRSISDETGRFSGSPGFIFGAFTSIDLNTTLTHTSMLLRTELNLVSIVHFNPKVKSNTINDFETFSLFDTKILHDLGEFCLLPTLQVRFSRSFITEIFVGPSVALGSKEARVIRLDNVNPGYPLNWEGYLEGFWGECDLNAGVTFYYDYFICELKYRLKLTDKLKDYRPSDLYLQVGLGF